LPQAGGIRGQPPVQLYAQVVANTHARNLQATTKKRPIGDAFDHEAWG
jgi:hypothetical protein